MNREGQRLDPRRYAQIPRTLSLLTKGGKILLIRIPEEKGAWGGKLNGVGGHVERGEDPCSSALREIKEEVAIEPQDLRLCGVVSIDIEADLGIGLYVFVGTVQDSDPSPGPEGPADWFDQADLESLPLVEDLPFLIPAALAAYRDGQPFSAVYRYPDDGSVSVEFAG